MKTTLLFVSLLISALANSQQQTQNICVTQPVPPGWVIIKYAPGANCSCGMRIQYIQNLPARAEVEICGRQFIPRGWVVVGEGLSNCGGADYFECDEPSVKIRRVRVPGRRQAINFKALAANASGVGPKAPMRRHRQAYREH